jgi:O-antigen ligase
MSVSATARIQSPATARLLLLAPTLFLLFWNVDFSVLFGALGASAVSVGRWIAIAVTFAAFLITMPKSPHVGRLLGLMTLLWFLGPSIVFSEDQFRSVVEFTRIASLMMLFWFLADHAELRDRIYLLTGVFAAAVVAVSVLHMPVAMHHLAGGAAVMGRVRDAGLTPHPNNFGFVANVGAAFALSLLLGTRRPSALGFTIIVLTFAASLLCLYASDSRTAWLNCVITLLLLFAWIWRSGRRPAPAPDLGVVARPLLFIGVILALSIPLILTVTGSDGSQFASNSSYAESNAARMVLWRNAFEAFKAHPLSGVGLGLGLQETFNPFLKVFNQAPYAHNALLSMMYISGIPGVAFLLFLVGACVELLLPPTRRYWLDMPREQRFFHSSVVVTTLFAGVMEGGLQNNYGMDCFIAIALGALAGARRLRPTPVRRNSSFARPVR